jgi:predicted nucleotidyltransferase
MKLTILNYLNKVSELCATYGVRRLELFGSASRSDFDLDNSDIDFLVDFVEIHPLGAFDRYFGLKEGLEQLFQRSVDLVEAKAIKNPYFKQAIERDRVLVYGPRGQEADLRHRPST